MSRPRMSTQPHSDDPRYTHPVRRMIDRLDWFLGGLFTKSRRLGYATSGTLAGLMFRVLFGLRVKDRSNVPAEGPLLVVCNHISNFDPPLVGAFLRRESYIAAKIELFAGFLGFWIRYHNAIPIRRGSGSDKDSLKMMVGLLKRGGALLMFPEGTRAKDPEKGGSAKAGPGMIAALGKPIVLPVRIHGTHNPKAALFKPGGMRMTFGEPVAFEVLLAEARARVPEDSGKKELYQALSDLFMERIRALPI